MGQYLVATVSARLGKRGQGMVEYALILAFVVVLAIALTGDNGVSNAIKGVFGKVTNQLNK